MFPQVGSAGTCERLAIDASIVDTVVPNAGEAGNHVEVSPVDITPAIIDGPAAHEVSTVLDMSTLVDTMPDTFLALDSALDLVPDQPMSIPDLGPDLGSDLEPDLGPIWGPDSGPDLGPDSGPIGGPDLGTILGSDSRPDLGPDFSPDLAPDLGHDTFVCQPRARDCTSSLDNDCNGTPDNQETPYCTCTVGSTQPCQEHAGLDGKGICTAGSQTCTASGDLTTSTWGTCTGSVGPTAENCFNLDFHGPEMT